MNEVARRGVCVGDALHQYVVIQGLGLRRGAYNKNTLDYSATLVFAMEFMRIDANFINTGRVPHAASICFPLSQERNPVSLDWPEFHRVL